MKNSIAERVSDFLKRYPPFNLLNANKLLQIAVQVDIIYLEKGKTLYERDEVYHDHFYVVRDGAINLYHDKDENQRIVGISDKGDIFGLRPLIMEENYKLTATANEESIVYAIPIQIFQLVTEKLVKVNKYLITSFASNTYDPYTAEENDKIFVDYIPKNAQDIANFQTANYTKNPITCHENDSLQEAAITMCDHRVGCIIVINDQKHPIGIVTNSDIKNKIATGTFPITTSVRNVMTSPIVTEKMGLTVADAQLQMIKHSIGHLCITEDGTPNAKLVGVLTHHDVLVTLGNAPSVLLKEIKRAKDTIVLRSARLKANTLLKSYLSQNIPLSHSAKIIATINDAVVGRVIELSIEKMHSPPPVAFSWLAIGSQGRKEQLLFTDQDNALVFEDVPEAEYETTQQYFLKLSRYVTESLHKIGFEYCDADMMASNPEWCRSVSEWKAQFTHWIMNPDEKAILLLSIFLDYSGIYGEAALTRSLTDSIYETLKNTPIFFRLLAKDALKNPPPLGFFKQFLVERNGDKKDLFNIKNRALMPLINAARLLCLSQEVKEVNNTYERFYKLAELDPNNKELFNSCAYAFKALLKFKTKQGIQNKDSGKFIALEMLTKEEQIKLKRCFKPIHDIQEVLQLRFDLKNAM